MARLTANYRFFIKRSDICTYTHLITHTIYLWYTHTRARDHYTINILKYSSMRALHCGHLFVDPDSARNAHVIQNNTCAHGLFTMFLSFSQHMIHNNAAGGDGGGNDGDVFSIFSSELGHFTKGLSPTDRDRFGRTYFFLCLVPNFACSMAKKHVGDHFKCSATGSSVTSHRWSTMPQ